MSFSKMFPLQNNFYEMFHAFLTSFLINIFINLNLNLCKKKYVHTYIVHTYRKRKIIRKSLRFLTHSS